MAGGSRRGAGAAAPDLLNLRRLYFTTHLAFGLLSVSAPGLLLGGGLATPATGFIFAWWAARMVLHMVGFETAEVAADGRKWWAKQALGCLFIGLTATYGIVFWLNLKGGWP